MTKRDKKVLLSQGNSSIFSISQSFWCDRLRMRTGKYLWSYISPADSVRPLSIKLSDFPQVMNAHNFEVDVWNNNYLSRGYIETAWTWYGVVRWLIGWQFDLLALILSLSAIGDRLVLRISRSDARTTNCYYAVYVCYISRSATYFNNIFSYFG